MGFIYTLIVMMIILNIIGMIAYGSYMFDGFSFGYKDYSDLENNLDDILKEVKTFTLFAIIPVILTLPAFLVMLVIALIIYTLNLTPFQ